MPGRYANEEAHDRYEDAEDERRFRAENPHLYHNDSTTPDDVGDGVSDFDDVSADIPVWGWLSGASARRDAARNASDRERAEQAWRSLGAVDPTVDELTSHYVLEGGRDEYGDLLGGPSALANMGPHSEDQGAALRALRGLYESGGYTDADMAASRAMRAQQAQALGSANQAALQQMQARGMGGSGAEFAARMQGSQAMAGANSQADAALQMTAMQRALGALQGYGSLATTMRDQEMQRRSALDAFNQGNMDWRRGRESRNTAYTNRGEDSRAAAEQQRYSNSERKIAGLTGQYSAGESGRQFDTNRRDEADERGAAAIGSLITTIASL